MINQTIIQIFEWVDRPSVWMDVGVLSFFMFIIVVCLVSNLTKPRKYNA